ncbi:MAG TPA: glycine--tRNA ligase subunit beta [Polyangiaceae bacterium]|nr:glycine--tRNA ligase subunit beta [Polyangiaceae bacterium]
MAETRELLFEIGCEELPASFVAEALAALPRIVEDKLGELRLSFTAMRALGTPRRLAVVVDGLALVQADLDESVMGPPVKAAFRDGQPTRAAEAFAQKLGCAVGDLERVTTDKGEYLRGVRREKGRPARELLPAVLASVVTAIPFRKSMRWGSGTLTFGRPVRWLLALLGSEGLPIQIDGFRSGTQTYGHRFLHPEAIEIGAASSYVDALRSASVLVDPEERRRTMLERLAGAAAKAGGTLIEDDFLVRENLSLVEDPQVVAGHFDDAFLTLPDAVILEVARGHQRYFGLRAPDGRLLPRYLAVVNTARNPARIVEGNDRVMRARLADARFFYEEDRKKKLADRRPELDGIVFQNRLGTILAKVDRIERLTVALGAALSAGVENAVVGARLCKCDLVTWMVGEFPELQGEMGRAYALAQGESEAVADVIRDHYKPRGATDTTAPSDAAALVALADRFDTLVGCFAIGLSPSGTADPYGLRRACIAALRTLLDRNFDLSLSAVFRDAHQGYAVALDLNADAVAEKLGGFFRDRLRHLLVEGEGLPSDAVDAALAVAADRPLDARARAQAIEKLDTEVRARVGEVFKRATNIAREAPPGETKRGNEPAEIELFDTFMPMRSELEGLVEQKNYAAAFGKLATLAPALGRYFDEVLVMCKEDEIRENRLRFMRIISETCSRLARLELLGARD